MSRSWRTHPCGQICSCKSEKSDKMEWHRKFRTKGRQSCRRLVQERSKYVWLAYVENRCFCLKRIPVIDFDTEDWEMDAFDIRQVSNPWWMMKDGKMWYVEDYTRKRDAVFKGRRVLWYCFTEPEWLTDREIRRLMSK